MVKRRKPGPSPRKGASGDPSSHWTLKGHVSGRVKAARVRLKAQGSPVKGNLGYEGQREPGYGRVERPDKDEKPKVGEVITASINLRETVLYWMWSREYIDDIQLLAGETYRRCWEALKPHATVPDLGRTIVDFSFRPDAGLIGKLHEAKRLAEADVALGPTDAELLKRVCGAGFQLKEVANHFFDLQDASKRQVDGATKYLGHRIADALEILVRHWKLKRREGKPRFLRSFQGLSADSRDWSYDPELAKAQAKAKRRRRRRR